MLPRRATRATAVRAEHALRSHALLVLLLLSTPTASSGALGVAPAAAASRKGLPPSLELLAAGDHAESRATSPPDPHHDFPGLDPGGEGTRRVLSQAIRSDKLTSLLLEPEYVFAPKPAVSSPSVSSRPLVCPNGEPACPHFASCGEVSREEVLRVRARAWDHRNDSAASWELSQKERGYDMRDVSMCSLHGWGSEQQWGTGAVNCPDVPCSAAPEADGCPPAHLRSDYCPPVGPFPLPPWSGKIYKVRNAYVDWVGNVFTPSLQINPASCAPESGRHQNYSKGFHVTLHDRVVHLVNYWSGNYYHYLMEVASMFLLLAHVPGALDAPIAIFATVQPFLRATSLGLLGVSLDKLQLIVLEHNAMGRKHLIAAKEVIMPSYPGCETSSVDLIRRLRAQHFLPPDGLPMFSANWTLRRAQAPPVVSANSDWPSNWVVVVFLRRASRKFLQHAALLSLVKQLFSKERVVVFDGRADITETKQLFNRALLAVGPHGAGLTNLLFMPQNAVMLELRPRGWPRWDFSHLANAVGISYFNLMCDGEHYADISCDTQKLEELVRSQVAPLAWQRLGKRSQAPERSPVQPPAQPPAQPPGRTPQGFKRDQATLT